MKNKRAKSRQSEKDRYRDTVAAKSLKAAKNMTQKSSELAMETNFFMKLGT
jgi:hypothetical protein